MYPVFFATFWIGFISFWTWGASQGSLLFAAFSIPFWLVGLGMWYGILVGTSEQQQLRVDTEALSFSRKGLFSSKETKIPFSEIESIDIEDFMPRDPFAMTRYMTRFSGMDATHGIPLPTICHGIKKTRFAEYISEAEGEWLCKMLRAVVFKRTNKRV